MNQAADLTPKQPDAAIKTTIRALRFDGTQARLEPNFALPEPAPGEAVIRNTKAAVSATDLEVCKGLFEFVGTLGHEFVGVVQSMNDETRPELMGKRVVGAIDAVCGQCDMCQGGLSGHCRKRTVLGMQGRDGCLADSFLLPIKNLVPVPDSVDDDHAVFAHCLASAIQAARQLTIEGRPYITVLGDGPLGLLTAQVMVKLNASVRLIGRYSEKLALCEKWGVKHRHADDIGRRADQDIVVDCTGSPDGLALATELVRPRGTILVKTLLATQADAIRTASLTTVVVNELTVLGSGFGPVTEAVSMLAQGEVDVVSLISKRVSLASGTAILQAASQPGIIKVLVDP